MPRIDILLLLLALALTPLAAHRKDETSYQRSWPQIEEIAFAPGAADGSSAAQLRIHAWADQTCAAPIQTELRYFPDNIDAQVYRDIPAAANCEERREPFTIDLNPEPGAEWTYIIVNDQVWARARYDNEWLYQELSLAPIFVDRATLSKPDAQSGERALRILGSQAVGCDLPLLFAWRETQEGAMLGVYNAIDPETFCPTVLVEIDETVELAATEMSVSALLSVNAYEIIETEAETVSDSDKVLTNIMRVDIHVGAARPARVSLEVEGEHPDGCDFPVLVDQTRAGNRINVEIYREVPADVICPMILRPYKGRIQLDGRFEKGSYSIAVNSHSQQLDI